MQGPLQPPALGKMKRAISAVFAIMLIISVSYAGLLESAKESIFGKDFPSCEGLDKDKIRDRIKDSDAKECEKYLELFDKYSLENTPFDSFFLMALTMMESGCHEDTSTRKGLLQALECKGGACDGQPDNQIYYGVEKHLIPAFNRFKQLEGYSGEDIVSLVLFEYNLGIGAGIEAKRLLGEKKSVGEAMDGACLKYYGASLCSAPGYGKDYPRRFFEERFNRICTQLGGNPNKKGVDIGEISAPLRAPVSKTISGTYSVRPTFEVNANKEITGKSNELLSKANSIRENCKTFSDEYDKCVDKKEGKDEPKGYLDCREISEKLNKCVSDNSNGMKECDSDDEKMLFSIVENYTLCRSSPEPLCYCDISPELPDSVDEFAVTIANQIVRLESLDQVRIVSFSGGTASEPVDGIFKIYDLNEREVNKRFRQIESLTYTFTSGQGFFDNPTVEISPPKDIWKNQKNIMRLIKVGNEMGMAMVEDETPSLPRCTIKKNIFRFCAKDESDQYFRGGPEKAPLQYKFAVDFSEEAKKEAPEVPPPEEQP